MNTAKSIPSTIAHKSTTVRSMRAPWTLRTAVAMGSTFAPERTAERALEWFTTPMERSRTRALAAETGGAAIGSFRFDGHTLSTYAWGHVGREPTVLLSHGWSSYGLRFLPWVQPLRELGYAVLAFDQPGHGRNAPARITLPGFADTVLALGRHYGGFAAAIGHSLGGAALAVAMGDGVQIGRALLIAPAADGVAASRRFARAVALPEPLRATMQARLELQTGRSMSELAIHRVAPHLGAPALVVHDLEDDEVPWEEGERYARYWPRARLWSVEGLGHHRIVTDPSVISVGCEFLSGTEVGERVVSTPELLCC